jgi:hypothetical protein
MKCRRKVSDTRMEALGFAILHPPTAVRFARLFATLQACCLGGVDGGSEAKACDADSASPWVPWGVARWLLEVVVLGDETGAFSAALPDPCIHGRRDWSTSLTSPRSVGQPTERSIVQVCTQPECGVPYAVLVAALLSRLSHQYERRTTPRPVSDPRHPHRLSSTPRSVPVTPATSNPLRDDVPLDMYMLPLRTSHRHYLEFIAAQLEQIIKRVNRRVRKNPSLFQRRTCDGQVWSPVAENGLLESLEAEARVSALLSSRLKAADAALSCAPQQPALSDSGEDVEERLSDDTKPSGSRCRSPDQNGCDRPTAQPGLSPGRSPSYRVRRSASPFPAALSLVPPERLRMTLRAHVSHLSRSFAAQETQRDRLSLPASSCGHGVGVVGGGEDDAEAANEFGVSLSARRGAVAHRQRPASTSARVTPATAGVPRRGTTSDENAAATDAVAATRYGGLGSAAFALWLKGKVAALLRSADNTQTLDDDREPIHGRENPNTAAEEDQVEWTTSPPSPKAPEESSADHTAPTPRDVTWASAARDGDARTPSTVPTVGQGSKRRRPVKMPVKTAAGVKPVNPGSRASMRDGVQAAKGPHHVPSLTIAAAAISPEAKAAVSALSLRESMHLDVSTTPMFALAAARSTATCSTTTVGVDKTSSTALVPVSVIQASGSASSPPPLERLLPPVRLGGGGRTTVSRRLASSPEQHRTTTTTEVTNGVAERSESAPLSRSANHNTDDSRADEAPERRGPADLRAHRTLHGGWRSAEVSSSTAARSPMQSSIEATTRPSSVTGSGRALAAMATRLKAVLDSKSLSPATDALAAAPAQAPQRNRDRLAGRRPTGAASSASQGRRPPTPSQQALDAALKASAPVAHALATVSCPASHGPIDVGGGPQGGFMMMPRPSSRGGPLPCGFRGAPSRLRSSRPFS